MSTTALEAPSPSTETGRPEPSSDTVEPAAGLRRWLTRPLVACLVLLAVYATITLAFNDPRGTLGTDTGSKLATLHTMQHEGTLLPEIGYWAASADPKGDVHPIFYTFEVDGKWVNVTTLPMIYAAYPLFLVGGDRAVLLLPMLGSIMCALAARALARKLGRGSGWLAFWAVGLLSPLAIYALDFWEHSIGLALMLWGVFWLLRANETSARVRTIALAGAFFGAAACMRTEALVYLVVCGGVVLLAWLWRTRSFASTVGRGIALLGGAAVPLLLNDGMERLILGGTIRAARATDTAAEVGVSAGTRVQEAFTTLLGMNRFSHTADFFFGALIVLCVALGVRTLLRADDQLPIGASVAFAAALFLYLVGFSAGLGFVPGMLTASPFAAVGLLVGWRKDVRVITVMAVAALPVVWVFQYSGGAGPQWGGRYTLLSGALLLVAAAVVLEGRRSAVVALCVVAALVTGFGLAWLSVRSTWAAHGIEQLVDRHDQAVISGEAHVLREGGAFYNPDRHWLTVTTDSELERAVEIVHEAGDSEFAYIVSDGVKIPAALGGYRRGGVERIAFLRPDIHLKVATFRQG